MNVKFTSKDVFGPLLKYFDDAWTIAGKGNGLTFPCVNPNKRIDYILVGKNSNIRVKNAYVIQKEASDHLPVVAEIDF